MDAPRAEAILTIWIIHRDTHHRAALARIAGASDSAVLGGPGDKLFESASPPGVVVLGLCDDFELELEFVHRHGTRLRTSAWVLLGATADLPEARRLFDTLSATYVKYPPDPLALRRAIRNALKRRRADSLSSRQGRDTLRDRFTRWFADIELNELMRAIDPRLSGVPVLIRGEEGTGRTLLARYIHAFGGSGDESFIHVSCAGIVHAEDVRAQIEVGSRHMAGDTFSIWLEDVDHLSLAVQRRVQDWIEFGLPEGTVRAAGLRWIGGAGDDGDLDAVPGLDARLAEALSGLTIRIPSLRERPGCIEPFVAESSLAWCNAHSQRPRRFGPEALMLLDAYPWPGNLHELEAVVIRTLSFTSADIVLPVHLRFPADSSWLEQAFAGPTTRFAAEREPTPPEAAHEETHPLPTVDSEDIPEATILDDEDWDDEIDEVLEPIELNTTAAEPEAITHEAAAESVDAAEQRLPSVHDTEPAPAVEVDLRRLIRAVAHEVRNPLVSIRTFSELLPDHYDDAEFRTQFRDLVSQDVRRIDEAVTRLQNMLELPEIKTEPVDVAHMLENLLDERRDEIQSRRLLVLKELDHGVPHALGDPLLLRDAFNGLFKRALARVGDRGDIYVASKHHATGLSGGPSLRILLRYTAATPSDEASTRSEAPHSESLDSVMAQTIVHSMGGKYTEDATDSEECVIVIDLPAPS